MLKSLTQDSGTVRRLVALALGIIVPFLNKFLVAKFGVSISELEVAALEGAVVAFIMGSNIKEAARIKAEAASASITTVPDAVKELSK